MTIGETKMILKDDLETLAVEVLDILTKENTEGAVVLALSGDLGAGKTTFTSVLAKQLGITETVVSPTFTIMKGYETTSEVFPHLVHMDAYRIDDTSELGPLRFLELLETGGVLLCLEWPEKISEALPLHILTLTLGVVDENTRTATLSR